MSDKSELRKFGPIPEDNAMVGEECPSCKKMFLPGNYVTLISLGPGDDAEQMEKCRAGQPYNAVALMVHWSCATGEQ